jgi:hypothetical protein
MILIVGIARRVVRVATLCALTDIYFTHFMGPMGPMEVSVIGAPIPSVAGAADGDTC